MERQPSSWIAVSSETPTISGLMKTCGFFGSSFLATSMVTMRCGAPTWIAASPTPGASYMVSNMSSTSLRTSAVIFFTGSETSRNRLSGRMRISRSAMAAM